MTAILQLDHVSKRFGGLQAVNDLSFVLGEGEILGLIGPNGAGKSTLFNLINGVYTPETGKIFFSGADITGEKPFLIARRGLARTHQIVQPLMNMTVEEQLHRRRLFRPREPAVERRRMTRRAKPPSSSAWRIACRCWRCI